MRKAKKRDLKKMLIVCDDYCYYFVSLLRHFNPSLLLLLLSSNKSNAETAALFVA